MTVSRRAFLAHSSLVLAGACVGRAWARQPAGQPPTLPQNQPQLKPRQVNPSDVRYFEWKKAADGVHVAFGEGGNTLVMLGDKESLLIDTKNAGYGDMLKREAASLGTPLAMVINTHHHADHTGGNSTFTPTLPVLAQAKAKPRIAANVKRYTDGAKGAVGAAMKSGKLSAQPIKDDALLLVGAIDQQKDPAKVAAMFEPTKTTDGNETITVGGKKVQLTHVGAGHTDNDLIAFLPDFNVLHTGDLVFHNWWPYVDRAGGADSAGWIRSCEKILSICNDKTVVVPGHGDLTDRAGVQAQIDFFKKTRDAAAKAVKDKTSREDFLKMPFDDYKGFDAASNFIRAVTLGGLYDEAAGTPAK